MPSSLPPVTGPKQYPRFGTNSPLPLAKLPQVTFRPFAFVSPSLGTGLVFQILARFSVRPYKIEPLAFPSDSSHYFFHAIARKRPLPHQHPSFLSPPKRILFLILPCNTRHPPDVATTFFLWCQFISPPVPYSLFLFFFSRYSAAGLCAFLFSFGELNFVSYPLFLVAEDGFLSFPD